MTKNIAMLIIKSKFKSNKNRLKTNNDDKQNIEKRRIEIIILIFFNVVIQEKN